MKLTVLHLFSNLHIAYGGIAAGNMDLRFGGETVVLENRAMLYAEAGMQTNDVIVMDAKGEGQVVVLHDLSNTFIRCDSAICQGRNIGLALFPADCIALVLYAENADVVALVHLGWKQLVDRQIERTLEKLHEEYRLTVKDIKAYVGFGIGPESYVFTEISEVQATSKRWQRHISKKLDGYHIDLPRYVHEVLVSEGVDENNIIHSGIDTGNGNEYFSNYRYNQQPDIYPKGRNGFVVYIS